MRRGALVITLIALALSACSGEDPKAKELSDRAIAATDDGRQAVQDYLDLVQQPPANTIAAWDAFILRNAIGISRVRTKFDDWNAALNDAVEGGVVELGDTSTSKLSTYLDAVGAWIQAQEEQVRRGRECHKEAAGDFGRFSACEADVVRQHGDEWNAVAERLNTLSRELGFS